MLFAILPLLQGHTGTHVTLTTKACTSPLVFYHLKKIVYVSFSPKWRPLPSPPRSLDPPCLITRTSPSLSGMLIKWYLLGDTPSLISEAPGLNMTLEMVLYRTLSVWPTRHRSACLFIAVRPIGHYLFGVCRGDYLPTNALQAPDRIMALRKKPDRRYSLCYKPPPPSPCSTDKPQYSCTPLAHHNYSCRLCVLTVPVIF